MAEPARATRASILGAIVSDAWWLRPDGLEMNVFKVAALDRCSAKYKPSRGSLATYLYNCVSVPGQRTTDFSISSSGYPDCSPAIAICKSSSLQEMSGVQIDTMFCLAQRVVSSMEQLYINKHHGLRAFLLAYRGQR